MRQAISSIDDDQVLQRSDVRFYGVHIQVQILDNTIEYEVTDYHCLPSSLRRQDISSHDIDYVEYVGHGLTWERILGTCVISMWSNDIKRKYMFMFPLQNLARKELIFAKMECCHIQKVKQREYPTSQI